MSSILALYASLTGGSKSHTAMIQYYQFLDLQFVVQTYKPLVSSPMSFGISISSCVVLWFMADST